MLFVGKAQYMGHGRGKTVTGSLHGLGPAVQSNQNARARPYHPAHHSINYRHLHCDATRTGREGSDDNKRFQALVEQLKPLSYCELQQLSEEAEGHVAFSASFLFWLSAQEKQQTNLQTRKGLASLAAQLVSIKEQADWEASKRLLPPLASSLAYSNYTSWQSSHEGKVLPDIAPGVSMTDFYKAAEREEAKLRQWQTPEKPKSSLDSFAASSGYQHMAAEAMARVRARLMGWTDDDEVYQQQGGTQGQRQQQAGHWQQPGANDNTHDSGNSSTGSSGSSSTVAVSPAAERVLQELLQMCSCREERATLLPDTFMPPGLEVTATGGTEGPARILSTPSSLLAAVARRLNELRQCQQASEQQQLPSGEQLVQVLLELKEDIEEYNTHVYSRLSKRDLHMRLRSRANMCAPAEPAVRPKVLVVDDMALNRKLLTAVCRKLGYETVEAVNGAHAVEVFTREGSLVACILLDLEMPVLDGWQAAQKLRDLEGSLAEVPIIACTACNLSELMPQGNLSVEQHTLACGINLCLNKPLSLTCLTAALEQLSVPTPARN